MLLGVSNHQVCVCWGGGGGGQRGRGVLCLPLPCLVFLTELHMHPTQFPDERAFAVRGYGNAATCSQSTGH